MANMLERNKKVKTPQKTYQEHAEDALYREVWEDVNNEKTQQFLKKYGRYMIAGALGIMIIVTAIQIGVRMHRAAKISTALSFFVFSSCFVLVRERVMEVEFVVESVLPSDVVMVRESDSPMEREKLCVSVSDVDVLNLWNGDNCVYRFS